ncbi:hypothetical protein [Gloeobacter kilaueensis]|nr:hypothetical protein [Gloeobacter kilaueensis]
MQAALLAAKLRIAEATAEQEEAAVAAARGRLLPAGEVIAEGAKMVAAFRARLLSLPTTAAPQVVELSAPEAEALLRSLVYEALAELAAYDPGDADSNS